MTARALLNAVHVMLLEAHGPEAVEEMLGTEPEAVDRRFAVIAMGGEIG